MATLATTTTAAPVAPKRSFLEVLGSIWAWLFLVLLIITFTYTGGGAFFSLANFQNILANMSILTIIAIGQTFVIISGGIDLSAGWIMGMVSVVSAIVMNYFAPGTSMLVIVLAGAAVGVVAAWGAGLVNGLLIAKLNVPPFIATLGMFGIPPRCGLSLVGRPACARACPHMVNWAMVTWRSICRSGVISSSSALPGWSRHRCAPW